MLFSSIMYADYTTLSRKKEKKKKRNGGGLWYLYGISMQIMFRQMLSHSICNTILLLTN